MLRRVLGLAIALIALQGGMADASCSLAPKTLFGLLANKRVKQKPDCSYVNGGYYDGESGEAAIDLGNGRVMQRVVPPGPMISERVILLDCASGDSLVVHGKADPDRETSCGSSFEVRRYEKPDGPLDYGAGADLSELERVARRYEVVVYGNAEAQNDDELLRDRVDYFCGCRLFYPGSPGAAK